jgi:hypothetical protein
MSDRLLPEDDHEVAQALRSLPLLQPPRSAWPALQATLPVRRVARTRRAAWLALAATIAMLAVLPSWLATPVVAPPSAQSGPVAATPAGPDTDDSASISLLMRESSQLEQWIAWSHSSAVDSGPNASLVSGLSERVQQIDALLERADLDADASLPLWQERVLRLRQMAHIENTDQLMAARGESDAGLPVLAF